jgi:hypothetical protein
MDRRALLPRILPYHPGNVAAIELPARAFFGRDATPFPAAVNRGEPPTIHAGRPFRKDRAQIPVRSAGNKRQQSVLP